MPTEVLKIKIMKDETRVVYAELATWRHITSCVSVEKTINLSALFTTQ